MNTLNRKIDGFVFSCLLKFIYIVRTFIMRDVGKFLILREKEGLFRK